jgi:hypothetical protein
MGFGMESKHLIIIGIWIFVIILILGFFTTGTGLEFFGYLILLFIAFICSIITEYLLSGWTTQGQEPSEDIQEIKSKIEQIDKDLTTFKKQ